MPPANNTKAQPVKMSSHRFDITVRDCMVWPDSSRRKAAANQPKSTHVLPTKGGLGKPNSRHFALPENGYTVYGAGSGDDGFHVVDALRGWPKRAQDVDQEMEYDILRMSTPLEQEAKQRKKKKAKKPKKNDDDEDKDFRRSTCIDERGPDPDMVDLISHKYLSEASREREEERSQEIYEQQMKIRRDRDRKFPKDIKATKTTQLRSMALAEKVEYSPHDLWQMPKFKSSAKPVLNTFRKRSSKMAEINGTESDYGKGYSCTCAEEQGGKAKYAFDDDYEPREFDLNDYTGAEKIQTDRLGDSPLSVDLDPAFD